MRNDLRTELATMLNKSRCFVEVSTVYFEEVPDILPQYIEIVNNGIVNLSEANFNATNNLYFFGDIIISSGGSDEQMNLVLRNRTVAQVVLNANVGYKFEQKNILFNHINNVNGVPAVGTGVLFRVNLPD